ncbi:MFS transporter [Pendulispora brunnea]|uniref:MFS transporter n=1 Tax=Pendulispora brunnea TaxID=2905690 RepID=A0ABZ2K2J8_9BACT
MPTAKHPASRIALTLLGVVLVAVNLRAPIAGVAPLLPEMRADLGLSRSAGGLLTSLPLLCFGGLSTVAAALGRRIGSERALVLAMLAMAVGSAARIWTAPLLFAGTIVIGAAITVGNVLVPSVIKQHFDAKQGLVTGIYTGALIGGAAIASAISAPLAHHDGIGWRGSLAAWTVPEVLALLVWLPALRVPHRPPAAATGSVSVLRSKVTWGLSIFMGSQSLTYFAVLTWLPALLQDEGVSAARAGGALAIFNILGIGTALVMPSLAARVSDQRGLASSIAAAWAVGIAGLLFAPGSYLLWASVLGLAQGASISLAFALIVLRSRTPEVARGLSGTVQSIGYLIGSAGPFVLGALRDVSPSWSVSLVALLTVVIPMAWGAWNGGRKATVG